MKKFIAAIIFAAFILSFTVVTVTAENFAGCADELKAAGLFTGSGDGYELDRAPTRAEAAVMLVRMLGKEKEAGEKNYSHPFKDVDKWADAYVGYLYKNGLTSGIEADKYGSSGVCDSKMFCAFVLRALGYSETAGDFKYNGVTEYARSVGIMDTDAVNGSKFLRGDCVAIMYNALFVKIKGMNTLLWEKLVAEKAVNEAAVKNIVSKHTLIKELNGIVGKEWKESGGTEAYTVKGSFVIKYGAVSSGNSFMNGLSMDMSVKMEYSVRIRDNSPESSVIYDIYTLGFPMNSREYMKDGYIYTDSMGKKTKKKITGGADVQEFYFYPVLSADVVKSISKKSADNGTEYTVALYDGSITGSSEGSLQLLPDMGMADGGDSMKNVVLTYSADKDGKITNFNMAMDLTIQGTEANVNADMKITAMGKDVKIIFPDFSVYVEEAE